MENARQAIKIARVDAGWSWTLVNGDGVPTAAGLAAEQQAAMETGWCAARLRGAPGSWPVYPDVLVERTDSGAKP